MPDKNPIYDFMKANSLTDKDEATFLKEYSDSTKARELFSFFEANKLTDRGFDDFYGTYLKKKDGFWSSLLSKKSAKPVQVTSQSYDPPTYGKALSGGLSGKGAAGLVPQTKEQIRGNRISSSIDKIEKFDADYDDFRQLYRDDPKQFEEISAQIAPGVKKTEIDAFYTTPESREDALIDRVTQAYKQQKYSAIKENSRTQRAVIETNFNAGLGSLSDVTGRSYQTPKNEQDVAAILQDINNQKTAFKMMREASSGSISKMVETEARIAPLEKELKEAEVMIRQNAAMLVGAKLLGTMSQTNPNLSSHELGKEIMKVIDPQTMEIYEQAGGGKPSSYQFGRVRETPSKAEAVDRMLVQIGNQVKRVYGNETAIESAENEEKTLKYKYTFGEQGRIKQKIASILNDKGIKPHKATEAQKDEAAKELSQEEQDMWFGLNKAENNTKLPSTGFGYSTKLNYGNTVEDAVASAFGFLIPNRKKERALQILEGMAVSDILGEHPEDAARLRDLKQKEKDGKISEDEKVEMEELKKFTDKRTWLQEKLDFAGTGVGQILGLGSISAFTGGLGNARSVLGAAKSLIAPSANRGGMMAASYLMSHENNAREALRMFPNDKDGIKRFVTQELFTITDMLVERIFPEEKYLQGVLKKDIARLIPNLTSKQLKQQLNDEFVKSIARVIWRGLKKTAETPAQEVLEEEIALAIKEGINVITNPDYEKEGLELDEIADTADQSFWGSLFMGAPKGLMANRNATLPLRSLWETATDDGKYTDVKMTILQLQKEGKISEEDANEKLKMLEKGTSIAKSNPVLNNEVGSLTEDQKPKYFAKLLLEETLNEKIKNTTDNKSKEQYKKQLDELDIEKELLLNPDMGSKKVMELLFNSELIPKQDLKYFTDENGKFIDGNTGEYLKMIAQQANGLTSNWEPAPNLKEAKGNYPQVILDLANERWSKEIAEGKAKAQPIIEDEKVEIDQQRELPTQEDEIVETEISQPIELNPNLPEGYVLPEQTAEPTSTTPTEENVGTVSDNQLAKKLNAEIENKKKKVFEDADAEIRRLKSEKSGKEVTFDDILVDGKKFTGPNGITYSVLDAGNNRFIIETSDGSRISVFKNSKGDVINPEGIEWLRYAAGKVDAKKVDNSGKIKEIEKSRDEKLAELDKQKVSEPKPNVGTVSEGAGEGVADISIKNKGGKKIYHGTSLEGELDRESDGVIWFTDDKKVADQYRKRSIVNNEVDWDKVGDYDENILESESGIDVLADEQGIDLKKGKIVEGKISPKKPLDLTEYPVNIDNIKEVWNDLYEKRLIDEKFEDIDEEFQDEIKDDYSGKAIWNLLEKEGVYDKAKKLGYDAVIINDVGVDGKPHISYGLFGVKNFESAPQEKPSTVTEQPTQPQPTKEEDTTQEQVTNDQQGGEPPVDEGGGVEGSEGDRKLSGIRKALVSEEIIKGVDLERVGDKEMMAMGRKIIDSGEVKPKELVEKIVSEKVGVLTPAEVVALITYKADIDNRLGDIYAEINEKQANGESIGTLGVEAKNLEVDKRNFDIAAVITANQQSMAFRLRQWMLDPEYNATTEIEKYKKNNFGEIPDEIKKKFEDLEKQITDLRSKIREAQEKKDKQEAENAINDILEDIEREIKRNGGLTEEEVQARIEKGVQEEIDAIYKKLPKDKKSIADKAIDALQKLEDKLKGKTYADPTGVVTAIRIGISTIKNAIKAGVAVADAIEIGIEKIREYVKKNGITSFDENDFRKDAIDTFEASGVSTKKKDDEKPVLNDDGTVTIPNKMVRNIVSKGVTDVDAVVNEVQKEVEKILPGVTKRQVRDYITGYGKKTNPTKDAVQQEINELKRVGKLLSELEDVQAGIRKTTDKQKRQALSQRERDLRRQIKALSKEIPFIEEELQSQEESRLSAAKTRTKNRIEELIDRLKNKNFSSKKPIPVKADSELNDLLKQKEALQEEYEIEHKKNEIKNRTWWQKVEDIALEIFSGIPRAIVAGADLSAMFVQGTRHFFTRPIDSFKAFGESLRQFVSDKRQQEWLDRLKSSKAYPLIRASKLAISDKDGKLSAKEQIFIINWLNQIYDIGATILGLGQRPMVDFFKRLNPFKASQRAFDGYLNYIRVSKFLKIAKKLEYDGYNFESNPKEFTELGDWVNTVTGRARLGSMESSSKWLSIAMFAPRKVAAELKLYTPYAFLYYAKMPKKVRVEALKELAFFASSFLVTNSLLRAALGNSGDDDDFWNPDSSNFLTHKIGSTNVGFGGGAKSTLVMLSRLFGKRYTDQYGRDSKLGERFGKKINTKWDVIRVFLEGKASPGASLILKKLDEKKGLENDDMEYLKSVTMPMWMQDLGDLYRENPEEVGAVLTLLSLIGANVRVVDEPKKSSKPIRPKREKPKIKRPERTNLN